MKIVGISGKRGSGKSTVAKALEQLGYCVISLSDPMKRFLIELDPVKYDTETLWGESEKRLIAREPLKQLGTEYGRVVLGEDIWINYALTMIMTIEGRNYWYDPVDGIDYNSVTPSYVGFVIPDIRFANEFHRIKQIGGEIWKCKRSAEYKDDNHPSEQGVATWEDGCFDRIIDNDLPKEDIWKQLQQNV